MMQKIKLLYFWEKRNMILLVSNAFTSFSSSAKPDCFLLVVGITSCLFAETKSGDTIVAEELWGVSISTSKASHLPIC